GHARDRDHVAVGPGGVHDGHLPRGPARRAHRSARGRAHRRSQPLAGVLADRLAAAEPRDGVRDDLAGDRRTAALRPRVHDDARRPPGCHQDDRLLPVGEGVQGARLRRWIRGGVCAVRRNSRDHDRHGALRPQPETGGLLMAMTATRALHTAGSPQPKRRFSMWHLVLAPIALLFVIPFAQMLMASLSPAEELVKFPPPFIPSRITFDGFVALFTTTDAVRWLMNSTIVSAVSIVSHVVLCSLAGYGFARLQFRGRNVGFFMIVATIMIPTQLLMIPTYIMFSKLGLVNTLAAAFVPWLASAFGIFLMRQFFLSIPAEVEEAAALDGANRLQIFLRVVLPLARPAMATLAIFTLLSSWNDLIWPLIAINDDNWFTVQLGIANFQGTRRTQWELLMAGNVVATAPLVLLFHIAQKQCVQTMTMSGLKGCQVGSSRAPRTSTSCCAATWCLASVRRSNCSTAPTSCSDRAPASARRGLRGSA